MIHKWEIKQFRKNDKNEYRIRLRCQEADFNDLKDFLKNNNIQILREFRSLSPNFNYVFYLGDIDETEIQKFSVLLKHLCNDGEYLPFAGETETEPEDSLKSLYNLLKEIYEISTGENVELKTGYYKIIKDVSKIISSISDFGELIRVLFNITKQLQYDKTILLLRDEDVYSFVDGYGVDRNVVGMYKIDIAAAEIIKELGKVVLKRNLSKEILSTQEIFKYFPVGVIISLISENELEGFILLNEKKNLYTEFKNESELLEIISVQISTIIRSLRLSKEAIIDTLTGVYRYNYFVKRLEEEIYRSQLYKHPLSLLMIDIDNFKLVNDNFGHEIGNMVLREVANILKENTKISDVVCRYGGDEFVIIFPETNVFEAYLSAERLRQYISHVIKITNDLKSKIEKLGLKISQEIGNENMGKEIKVTASMGLAFITGKEQRKFSTEELVSFADKALYIAKMEGKNKVKIWNEEVITDLISAK